MGTSQRSGGVTLKQLLLWFVFGLLLVLLGGNVVLNIHNARSFLQQQLQTHAQDAATSLGLSLSTVIDASDTVAAGSMIDAIYDSGYYRQIIFYDVNGKKRIERESPMLIEGVPQWFVKLIPLDTPEGVSEVVSGWRQLGRLSVRSHPGHAYAELWSIMKSQLYWFGGVGVLAFIVMQAVITMILLPLMRVERQAREMSENRFDYRAPIPGTRELKRVALAMNDMADRLGRVFQEQISMIEHLRQQSFQDELTGLGNREGFDSRLRAEIESEQFTSQGSLLLLQIRDFGEYNHVEGRAAGDELLKSVAASISKKLKTVSRSFSARRAGADFAIFLPQLLANEVDDFARSLLADLNTLHQIKSMLRNDVVHVGIAETGSCDSLGDLLSRADMALRQAQQKGPGDFCRFSEDLVQEERHGSLPAGAWQALLKRTIHEQSLVFHFQPVYARDGKTVIHNQVLSRIQHDENLLVAGEFLPMVERFDMLVEFDRLVVELALRHIKQAADDGDSRYCINLSVAAVSDSLFIDWLAEKMQGTSDVARKLVFEVSEYAMQYSETNMKRLSDVGRQTGYRLSLDQFGVAAVAFSYLQRVSIDYIKIDHSFIRNIQNSRDNQFFMRSVMQIAKGQKIQLIAVGVENEEEWNTVLELGVDGAMGYFLCKPQEALK